MEHKKIKILVLLIFSITRHECSGMGLSPATPEAVKTSTDYLATAANTVATQSCDQLTNTIKSTQTAIDGCNQTLAAIAAAKTGLQSIQNVFPPLAETIKTSIESIKINDINAKTRELTTKTSEIWNMITSCNDAIKSTSVGQISFVQDSLNWIEDTHKNLMAALPLLVSTALNGTSGVQKNATLSSTDPLNDVLYTIAAPSTTVSKEEGVSKIDGNVSTGITGIITDINTFLAQKTQIEQDLLDMYTDLTTKETEITQRKNNLEATKKTAETAKSNKKCP